MEALAGLIYKLVMFLLDLVLKGEAEEITKQKLFGLAMLFDECAQVAHAAHAAIADGVLTAEEVQAILDEADDVPGALDALFSKLGDSGAE